MIPSRRIIRFFLIYGVMLFFVDQLLISSSRSVFESAALVLAAVVVVTMLYSLIVKIMTDRNSSRNDS